MSDLISVIVPNYNTEKYIARCLNSIINQTYKNIEIIVIDDGSSDSSVSIIEELSKKDNRIRLLVSDCNRGASFCRNKEIDNANGRYITFADSDDYLKPDYIKVLYNALKDKDINTSFCLSIKETDLEKQKSSIDLRVLSSDTVIKGWLNNNDLQFESPVKKLIKKELFDSGLRFKEGFIYEDVAFCGDLLKYNNGKNLIFIDYYSYICSCDHEDSVTRKKYSEKHYDKTLMCKYLYKELYAGTKYETLAYNKYLGELFYYTMKANNYRLNNRKEVIKECEAVIRENGYNNAKFQFYPFILLTQLKLTRFLKVK